MSRKRYLCIILFIVVGMTALAQDTTSVKKTNFIQHYWQSLIHGNVDRTVCITLAILGENSGFLKICREPKEMCKTLCSDL